MTLFKQLLCGGVAALCALDSAHSAAKPTPLIDYSPHGETKLSGDFGDAVGTKEDGTTTTSWVPTQGTQAFSVRNDIPPNTLGTPQAGTATHAVIGRRGKSNGGQLISFGQSTGHQLTMGDKFDVEFSWLNAAGWNNKKTPHTIYFSLFYTDNDKIDGERTVLHQFTSASQKVKGTWQKESYPRTKGLLKKKAVGKTLFVDFTSNADVGRFARLDNVHLAVTQKSAKSSASRVIVTPAPTKTHPVVVKPVPAPAPIPAVAVKKESNPESAALVGIGRITIAIQDK